MDNRRSDDDTNETLKVALSLAERKLAEVSDELNAMNKNFQSLNEFSRLQERKLAVAVKALHHDISHKQALAEIEAMK